LRLGLASACFLLSPFLSYRRHPFEQWVSFGCLIGCQNGAIVSQNAHKKTKKARKPRLFQMVVGQGFEPWKAMPTDLQGVDWVLGVWKNPCFIGF